MIDVYPASALAFPATTMCLRGQPAISSDHIESADFWQLRFLQMSVSTIPINPIPLILKHPP